MPLPGPSPAIHAALCSSSSLLCSLSFGGSLPPLLWWQVPSEVFNHLSCKTPFNWNYPLADKLLEPYQGGDIVAGVFHAGRFCFGLLLSLFSYCLSLSSVFTYGLSLVFFPNWWSFISVFLLSVAYLVSFFFSTFFQVWKLTSQASGPVSLVIQVLLLWPQSVQYTTWSSKHFGFYLTHTDLWTTMTRLPCCELSGVTG